MRTETQSINHFGGSQQSIKFMLVCGILFGPIFYFLVVLQILIRPEYHITRHPISLLALGDLGWMQTTNFILTGMLAIFGGFGMNMTSSKIIISKFTSFFTALFGVGVIIAAIFPSDPSLGFPPGTPEETSTDLSRTAMLHGVGFMIAFGSLTIVSFLLYNQWKSQAQIKEGRIALIIGVLTPMTIIAGFILPSLTSILFAIVGIPVFGLVNMVNLQLLKEFNQTG